MSKARDLAAGTFSGSFSADSPTLVVDDVNNRVGVGTVSPSQQITLVNSSSSKIQIKGHSASNGLFIGMDSATAGQFWNAENGYIRFATNDTERARFDSNGHLILKKNLVLESTSEGIDFSGVGSSAQTLDSYEEGTWTPSFVNGSFTFGNRNGYYTKIGNIVWIAGNLYWTAKSGSGGLEVTGMPFTPFSGDTAARSSMSVGTLNNIDNNGNKQITISIDGNVNKLFVRVVVDNAVWSGVDVSACGSSGELQFSGVYRI